MYKKQPTLKHPKSLVENNSEKLLIEEMRSLVNEGIRKRIPTSTVAAAILRASREASIYTVDKLIGFALDFGSPGITPNYVAELFLALVHENENLRALSATKVDDPDKTIIPQQRRFPLSSNLSRFAFNNIARMESQQSIENVTAPVAPQVKI